MIISKALAHFFGNYLIESRFHYRGRKSNLRSYLYGTDQCADRSIAFGVILPFWCCKLLLTCDKIGHTKDSEELPLIHFFPVTLEMLPLFDRCDIAACDGYVRTLMSAAIVTIESE